MSIRGARARPRASTSSTPSAASVVTTSAAAWKPFAVGAYSSRQADPTQGAINALLWVAVVPIVALVASRLIVETAPVLRATHGSR